MYSLAIFIIVVYTQNVYSSEHHKAKSLPVVLHNGYLADTHEVAAAKSAHLAALSNSKLSHGYSGHYGHGAKFLGGYKGYNGQEGSYESHGDYRYHGPIAIPHVLHDGHIADTHEVAAAKAKHLAAVAKAKSLGGYNGQEGSYEAHGNYKYHGATAIPHLLRDGHIADTHEVAVAKAEHLASVAKATSLAGYKGYNGQEGSYGAHGNYKYHGATAVPHVLRDGHIEDTHEVTLTKIKHFAAVAKAKTLSHGDHGNHAAAYHGLLANPVVLSSGYLADTHEVAAAKSQHIKLLHSNH